MVIGHTESRNDYEAIHQGEYMSVSGVRPSDWSRFLRGKDIPINSLRGGVAVFNYYLHEECNGKPNAMLCAATRYKGIQSSKNMKLAYQVVNTYNKIMELEKQRDPSSFGTNGKKPTAKFGNLGQNEKVVKVVKTKATKIKKRR